MKGIVREKAILAGLDMDMCIDTYLKYCKNLIAKKIITEGEIDTLCLKILEAKWNFVFFRSI